MKRILGALSILSVLTFTSCVTGMDTEEDYSKYKSAKGTIVHVQAPFMKDNLAAYIYKVEYTPEGAAGITKSEGYLLNRVYKMGDTLTIYYNPENPADEVYDQK